MTYQTAFPDYPLDAFPALPHGFADSSFANDISPSMLDASRGLRIWCDYPERDAREFTDSPRFILCHESGTVHGADICLSENWADILAALQSIQ